MVWENNQLLSPIKNKCRWLSTKSSTLISDWREYYIRLNKLMWSNCREDGLIDGGAETCDGAPVSCRRCSCKLPSCCCWRPLCPAALSSLTGTSPTAPTPPEGLFLYQLLHIFRILRYVCLPLMGILHHDSMLFSTLLWSKGVWHHRLFVTLDFMCWKSIETYALFSFIVLCEANTLLLAHYALYYLRKHQLYHIYWEADWYYAFLHWFFLEM
jgi:hypothetical protein